MSAETFTSSARVLADVPGRARIGQWSALIGAALFTLVPALWWPVVDRLSAGVERSDLLTGQALQLHALRHSLDVPAALLLALGLLAAYTRYRRDLGALGQAGLAIIVFSLVVRGLCSFAVVLTDGLTGSHVDALEIGHLTPVITMLGSVPFGIAVLRSRILSRLSGILVLLPALLVFLELGAVGMAEGVWWVLAECLMSLNGIGFLLIAYAFWRQR